LNYNYDPVTNRLSSVSGGMARTIAYDTWGNMSGDGVRALTFGADGSLRNTSAPVTKQYVYSGTDHVIKETSANGIRYQVYSGNNLLLEYEPGKDSYVEHLYLGNALVGSRRVERASMSDSDLDGRSDVMEFSASTP